MLAKLALLALLAAAVAANSCSHDDTLDPNRVPPHWDKLVEMLPLSHNVSVEEASSPSKLHTHCATDSVWDWKLEYLLGGQRAVPTASLNTAGCQTESDCDDPDNRDKYLGTKDALVVNIVVNVLCYSEGVCAGGVDDRRVHEQLEELEKDYRAHNIQFRLNHAINYYVDPEYVSIAKYGVRPKWYNDIEDVKRKYAYEPEENINIFVTEQDSGTQGTLLGIGTFPWDPSYSTCLGGLWMNAKYFGANQKTLSHEFGHNLGLWHSFHGVSEVKCGHACYEPPHEVDDVDYDFAGDFCSDTRSSPRNYYCTEPSGGDECQGDLWTLYGTDLNNIMAYTPDSCMSALTEQQGARAHCYMCNVAPEDMSHGCGKSS